MGFLGIKISGKNSSFAYFFCRKRTTTNHIVHNIACQPYEREVMAIRYIIGTLPANSLLLAARKLDVTGNI